MRPQIEPRFPFEEFGPFAFAHRHSAFPYAEGKYAPHLHIQAYHEDVDVTQATPYANEIIELSIPRAFTLSDTKQLVAENEEEMFLSLKTLLDEETDYAPATPTYGSMIPCLGKEVEVRTLPENTDCGPYLDDTAIYLEKELSPNEIREAVLDVLGDKAYSMLKPRLDRFARKMGIKYRSLDIDDGRRTFGTFHSRTKEICLSRRLLMMNESIIDFLIVHELAHGKHLPHGPEHDAIMADMLPDHEDADIDFSKSCDDLLIKGWL